MGGAESDIKPTAVVIEEFNNKVFCFSSDTFSTDVWVFIVSTCNSAVQESFGERLFTD